MPSKLEMLAELAKKGKKFSITPKNSVIRNLENIVNTSEGAYGKQRVIRAADEISGLERMYSPDALRRAFTGPNTQALVTMPPKKFEQYSAPIGPKRLADQSLERFVEDLPPMTRQQYIDYLAKISGGMEDVPYLELSRKHENALPYISGHEGRHRSRAFVQNEEPSSLVRIEPRTSVSEDLPRSSREEFIEALRDSIGNRPVVRPETYISEGGDRIEREIELLPPIYKKGGAVSQDAMRLAVMNQKVQKKAGGGALKTAKELWDIAKGTRSKAAQIEAGLYHPIGGGVKLSKPVPFMDFKTVEDPSVKMAKRRVISPESLQGGVAIPFVGDRAAAGKILTDVGGKRLSSSVTLEGGPEYMLTHSQEDPSKSAVWSSAQNVITGLGDQARYIAESGKPIYGVNVIGSPTNVDFNTMLTEAILGQYDPSLLTKKARKDFTKTLRTYAPDAKKPQNIPGADFVGADDVEAMRQQLMSPKAGELRKAFVDRMGTAKFQAAGFPDVAEARLAITEPNLVDTPLGAAGFTIAKVDPTGKVIETPIREHKTYPVALGGTYEGSLETPIDYKDFFQAFNEKRRLFGANPASDYRSFSLSPQFQELDQQWLDSIMKAQGKDLPPVSEYKDGGAVHMKDGNLVDELINEAKKKQQAPVNPFRMPTEKQSQYEKDIRQNMANQQEARERLFSDRIPSSVGEAKDKAIGLLQGAGGALAGYGSQVAGGFGDAASLYQEFKPESFPDLPAKVQALPTTEDIQDLLREHVNPSPEFAAGISGGNAAALIQGAASLPALARGAAKGATAGSKALANEAAYRIHQAMTKGEGSLAPFVTGVAPRQLITYHGTPHRMAPTKKNPLGEFDPTKIGTGEGAQVYGYGHYLAEVPDVAKIYQPRDLAHEQELLKLYTAAEKKGDYSAMEILENAMTHKTPEELRGIHGEAGEPVIKQIDKIPRTVGALYKVDLPDEHIAKMLDWDKSLSEQPESVQKALQSSDHPMVKYVLEKSKENPAYGAQDLLMRMAGTKNDSAEASQHLRELGIPGVKYLDQGSRDAGEGTRNFVVFPGNEHMMDIVGREKDGGVVRMAGGGKVGALKALGEIFVGGAKVKVRPPSDNVANVRDANFQYPRTIGNQNVSIGDLKGGVRFDKQESQRVNQLAAKIASPEGYISRIIVDHDNNVVEGQHRLEALRKLGAKEVPVYKIEDLAETMPVAKMESAIESVGAIHSDHVHQLMQHVLNDIAKHGIEGARQMDAGAFQKYYDAALDAASRKAPQEDALRLAQERAALPVDQGGLGVAAPDLLAAEPEKKAKGGPVSLDAMRLALQNKKVQHKAGGGALRAIGRGYKGMREPVKPKSITKEGGGNWLAGSVEGAMKPLKRGVDDQVTAVRNPATGAFEYLPATPDPMNQFIDKQLTRYVKNQMATKEDPIRALAEKGAIHTNIPIQPGGAWVEGRVPAGESDQAKNWDALVDQIPLQAPYREHIPFVDYAENEADNLRRLGGEFAVNNPEALAYQFNRGKSTRDLGFDHLIDELRNATNPASGLPRELLIKPESLSKLSVPQAVERVAKINEWRAAQKAEADIVRARNPATFLHKDYPDKGYSWQELKLPETPTGLPEGWKVEEKAGVLQARSPDGNLVLGKSMPDLVKNIYLRHPDTSGSPKAALEDALKYEGETMGHCVGGYCPDVVYGKSRIFSLRDAKGQPHVTVEVEPHTEGYNFLLDDDIASEIGANQIGRIKQIKGKSNKAPNAEYLPFVQDFVKSGKWSDVGDFSNTGLMRIAPESNEALYLQRQNKPIPEYVSDQEYEEIRRGMADAMRSPYGAADEGMKEGGVAHLGAGGFLKKLLPMAEREANKAKFLEASKVQERLYHGTSVAEDEGRSQALKRLKPSKEGALGSGVYLTPSAEQANMYTRRGIPAGGGYMLPVHAQLKNPLILDGPSNRDPMIEALTKLGVDESKAASMVNKAYEEKGYIGKQVQSRAQAQGYDGLMQYRDGELGEVVAYNPNAVKSAIGNEGTYDIYSPELNKAKGGSVSIDAMRLAVMNKQLRKHHG